MKILNLNSETTHLEKNILWHTNTSKPALKQLSRLGEVKQTLDRPLVPNHARKKPIFRHNAPNELIRSKIVFIKTFGGKADRINNTCRQITTNGRTKWAYDTGNNGTEDISATWLDRSIKIEIKATEGKKQSESQKEYQDSIEKAGGTYLIARNMDGFVYLFFKAEEAFQNGN